MQRHTIVLSRFSSSDRLGPAAKTMVQIQPERALTMLKIIQCVPPVILLVIATTLEVSGDAVIRLGLYDRSGAPRIALFLAGAVLLFGYGSFLNLTPVVFGRVVGLYIATLFVIWQLINYVVFRTVPTLPIIVGGALVISGGAIITFWRSG